MHEAGVKWNLKITLLVTPKDLFCFSFGWLTGWLGGPVFIFNSIFMILFQYFLSATMEYVFMA